MSSFRGVEIDSLKEWFEQNSRQQIGIWCEDPETHKERLGGFIDKTYVSYRVLVKQVGRDLVSVRHRYSEFEATRNTLFQRYSPFGIAVPALPPKKQISSLVNTRADALFVKERTHGLTMFCDTVVAIPFLRHDNDWKDFLKAPNAPSCMDSENTGETMLLSALTYLDVPFKQTMIQRMAFLREECSQVDRMCRSLLDKLRALQSAERSVQAASEGFCNTMQSWGDMEALIAKKIGGGSFDEDGNILEEKDQLSTTLKKTSKLYLQKHVAMDDNPDYESVLLATALETELVRMDALREVFKVHDDIVAAIENLQVKIVKAETGRLGRASMESVPEFKLQLEEKNACLQAFHKGLVYFTLPFYARLRAQTFRRIAAFMGASMLSTFTSIQLTSMNFMNEMQLNTSDAHQELNQSLKLLQLNATTAIASSNHDNNSNDDFPKLSQMESAFSGLFSSAVNGKRPVVNNNVNTTNNSNVNTYENSSNNNNNNINNTNNNYSNNNININKKVVIPSSVFGNKSSNAYKSTTQYDYDDGNNTATNNNTNNNINNNNNININNNNNDDLEVESISEIDLNQPSSSSSTTTTTTTTSTTTTSSPRQFQATEKSKALLSDLMGSEPETNKKEASVWD